MGTITSYPTAVPASTDYVLGHTTGTRRFTVGDVVASGSVYGSLYYSGAGSTITLTTEDQWYGATGLTAGPLQGLTADTADATADHLTVVTAGIYRLTLTACYSTSALGTYELSAHVGGVECPCGAATERYLAAGDVGSVAGHSVVSLAVGAEVSLRARCTSAASKTLTLRRACLSLERVG